MKRDAVIDGPYRYWLTRRWNPTLFDGVGTLGFVMLNPSTADADRDDPTIRRLVGFASREHLSNLVVVNVYAWRATDPSNLPADELEAVGPKNEWYLKKAARECQTLVCAWGSHVPKHRSAAVVELLRSAGALDLRCLGTTKDGEPRHPLYIAGNQPFLPYPPSP